MSSIWTPGGEHPVDRQRPAAPPAEPPSPSEGPPADVDAAQMEALRKQLAETPVAAVLTNHCLAIWELAALHLSLQPPQLEQASIAIDALGAIIERLEGRLGDDEATLRESLAQLRLAFVQIKGSAQA